MWLLGQDALEQMCRVRPGLLGPLHHARGRPLQMRLVTLGPVLVLGDGMAAGATAEMRSHALPFMKNLHGCPAWRGLPPVPGPACTARCRSYPRRRCGSRCSPALATIGSC